MARKPLIAGNWKMNLNHFEAIALVQKIAFALPDKYFAKVDVTVLPPFTDLRSVQTLVDGDKLRLTYGAQDVSQHDSGAYTGEISGAFLAKLGVTFAVVGHSERRTYHGETDELVAAKAAAALKHGLTPIVCIGESLEVREAGNHVEFNVESLRGSLAGLKADQIAQVVIAKYLNHMPLHRQAAHYARLGVLLATTTLYGWIEAAARDLAVPVLA